MPQNKIEIYQDSDGSNQIKVQFDGDTVWLNRNQLSQLFNRDVKTIGKHLTQIFIEGELSKQAVVAKFGTTTTDGKTYQIEHFNLDVIISVGYRVKSREGTQFRIWANRILKEHLINGYTLNQRRLAQKEQEVQILKDGNKILERAAGQLEIGFAQNVFYPFFKT